MGRAELGYRRSCYTIVPGHASVSMACYRHRHWCHTGPASERSCSARCCPSANVRDMVCISRGRLLRVATSEDS
ncbi:hypothetical protein BCV69DRAFT_36277 [Microstroma glucosiphilum]|uniref:Uncharacterized protein n=1 Tax=Pseudomicrostroma glucosiphilum TaxID=1684307 RepID=A0A316U3I6_9BASI|nr:hypothetical protein BCV69DRAFT_36277 [Pseudomicrostroma glucosiphilum]PWN19862.1 hypothetical protein BCV69DRAFT_36277 [Pseudomicrostroma glucosiphilum]